MVNFDRVPLGMDGIDDRLGDMTDAGQVFDVMQSYAGFDELVPGTGVPSGRPSHMPITCLPSKPMAQASRWP